METRVGKGGALGASNGARRRTGKLCTPLPRISRSSIQYSESRCRLIRKSGGGLRSLSAATGATVWNAPPAKVCGIRKNCSPAQSGAVTATPEYVLSGSVDGHLRAYSAAAGKVLWDYNTARPFVTVNGVKANSGSVDSAGPTLAGGMLFVNSGYGLHGGKPGNVLIAFAPHRQKSGAKHD